MLEIVELLIHFIATVIKLLKPGGVKVVMAETMVMKHQLTVTNRGKKRSPALITRDRFLFGLLAMLIGDRRLKKVVVMLKPATVLTFHKALVKRKYSQNITQKPTQPAIWRWSILVNIYRPLSSDNDPLFLFHRWKANLRVLEIDEMKSVPGTPTQSSQKKYIELSQKC